jgi:hypothetical protein
MPERTCPHCRFTMDSAQKLREHIRKEHAAGEPVVARDTDYDGGALRGLAEAFGSRGDTQGELVSRHRVVDEAVSAGDVEGAPSSDAGSAAASFDKRAISLTDVGSTAAVADDVDEIRSKITHPSVLRSPVTYRCAFCGVAFKSDVGLKRHLREHRREREEGQERRSA